MKNENEFKLIDVDGIVTKVEDAKEKLKEQKENLQRAALVSFLVAPTLLAAVGATVDEQNVELEEQTVIETEVEEETMEEEFPTQEAEEKIEENLGTQQTLNVNTIKSEDNDNLVEILEDMFDTDNEIMVYKNESLTAYKLTTEVTKEDENWNLVGELNEGVVAEIVNLNVDSEPEELGIWQERILDENGAWQTTSDIMYSVEKPDPNDEKIDWIKIGQEYMAVINTNYDSLHLYASENEDSMIITDPVYSVSIGLLENTKLNDLGKLSALSEVVLGDLLGDNNKQLEVSTLEKEDFSIETNNYDIDGVQRVINVDENGNETELFTATKDIDGIQRTISIDDAGNQVESFIPSDGLEEVVIDLENGSVSYSQEEVGRSK